ncbi:unnamed protein product, partial [Prorocentrum cordatum]
MSGIEAASMLDLGQRHFWEYRFRLRLQCQFFLSDFIISRLQDGARDSATTRRNIPVSLGGARDHWVVEGHVSAAPAYRHRSRCPARLRWDRTLLSRCLQAVQIYDRYPESTRITAEIQIALSFRSELDTLIQARQLHQPWAEALLEMTGDHHVTLLWQELHDGTCYLLRDHNTGEIVRRLVVRKGVRQGSTEGPTLFIVLYDFITGKVFQDCKEEGYRGLTVSFDASLGVVRGEGDFDTESADLVEFNLSHAAFIDDLLTFELFDDDSEVPGFLSFLYDTIEKHQLKVNVGKTELLVLPIGSGMATTTKKIKKKKIRFDVRGSSLPALLSVKYLGVQVSMTGTAKIELDSRLKKANAAYARLAARPFKKSYLTLRVKVRLWTALVRSIALYAAEAAVHTVTDERRLERWQTKQLRSLAKLPAHISRIRNGAVRKRCRVWSVASELCKRRLLRWQHIVKPAFVPDEPRWWEPDASEHYDPTYAVRAVMFGRFSFESSQQTMESDRYARLRRDLEVLWLSFNAEERRRMHEEFTLSQEPTITSQWLRWLANLPRAAFGQVLSFDSPHDPADGDGGQDVAMQIRCEHCGTCSSHSLPMFDPVGSSAAKRDADAMDRDEDEAEDGKRVVTKGKMLSSESKLIKCMAKLLLQHEDLHCATARDQNLVLITPSESPLDKALGQSVEAYGKAGTQAKKHAKGSSTEYRGNPEGKKPDAFLRFLLFRTSETLTEPVCQKLLEACPETGRKELTSVLEKIKLFGEQAKVKGSVQATRCFYVSSQLEDGTAVTKWIFNTQTKIEVMNTFAKLLEIPGMAKIAGWYIERDHAPRAGAAKELEAEVFQRNKGKKGKSRAGLPTEAPDPNASRAGPGGAREEGAVTVATLLRRLSGFDAEEDEEQRCPLGYERVIGHIEGGDQWSGTHRSTAESIDACALRCSRT